MPGDKKTTSPKPSAAGLKSDACANLPDQNVISGKAGGVGNNGVAEQSFHYPSTVCYDHHYPGHTGTYRQSDSGASYTDNGSLLYFMPGYNPYAPQTFLGFDGQHSHFSSMGSNGSTKSNGFNSKRSMPSIEERSPNYPLDMQSRKPTSNISQSVLQSQHLCSLNKLGGAYQSGHDAECYQPCSNFSSFPYQNHGLFARYSMMTSPQIREKSYANRESEELTCGPRSQSSMIENEEPAHSEYNLDVFQTKYEQAKFYVIKSYSEDDVHKCVKYDVWSSTPNGNKKLDVAFHEAEGKTRETGSKCPVFLFFSVNGSGQFVGVAEMIGLVDFEKNMDFWQLDKWSGFFPVKWHIIKDVPNTHLRHIILENNDNRPVTYTRDTQEVGLQQGLEMLEIFKSYPSKTSLLDDLSFYENREKLLKARRMSEVAFKTEKNSNPGEGSTCTNGSLDSALSLVNLTRNLSLNTSLPKGKPAT